MQEIMIRATGDRGIGFPRVSLPRGFFSAWELRKRCWERHDLRFQCVQSLLCECSCRSPHAWLSMLCDATLASWRSTHTASCCARPRTIFLKGRRNSISRQERSGTLDVFALVVQENSRAPACRTALFPAQLHVCEHQGSTACLFDLSCWGAGPHRESSAAGFLIFRGSHTALRLRGTHCCSKRQLFKHSEMATYPKVRSGSVRARH